MRLRDFAESPLRSQNSNKNLSTDFEHNRTRYRTKAHDTRALFITPYCIIIFDYLELVRTRTKLQSAYYRQYVIYEDRLLRPLCACTLVHVNTLFILTVFIRSYVTDV